MITESATMVDKKMRSFIDELIANLELAKI